MFVTANERIKNKDLQSSSQTQKLARPSRPKCPTPSRPPAIFRHSIGYDDTTSVCVLVGEKNNRIHTFFFYKEN